MRGAGPTYTSNQATERTETMHVLLLIASWVVILKVLAGCLIDHDHSVISTVFLA